MTHTAVAPPFPLRRPLLSSLPCSAFPYTDTPCCCLPTGHLTAVLGVFQKLVASKANDIYGFTLLRGILQYLPLECYQQYMPTVWQLLFTRLQVCVRAAIKLGLRILQMNRGF